MTWQDDKPRDECGVFGVYAPGRDVARLTFFALYALQHRGQESAGIATSNGRVAYAHKGMGLVAQVFNEDNLRPLKGDLAIGHNRYSTTGSSHLRNVQPYLLETIYGPLGVAHNGNLTNALDLRRQLLQRGVGLSSTTDTEVITQILAAPADTWLEEAGSRGAGEQGRGINNGQQLTVNSQQSTSDDERRTTNDERPITNNQSPITNNQLPITNNQSPITNYQLPITNNPSSSDRWIARLRSFMQVAEGAYSLAVLTRDAVYAVRDPLGLRPLCLGELEGGGYVVASETCALLTIGARHLRDVAPGEIVRLDAHGVSSYQGQPPARRALCIFEYVYFARPDSVLEGQLIHQVRQQLGRQLAREAPADADIVVGVPDSATPAAIGYSLESGYPYTEGLTKNRYIGRTFIQPDDHLRKIGVHLKYNPLTDNLAGKRVVLVDDSIVRGNTAGPLVQLLRDGGAAEVHMRVSSPPVRHPCFMGVDMATRSQLIGHRMTVAEISRHIGADSLAYLSLAGMNRAVREATVGATGHCTACFSGNYPINIPDWLFDEDREKLIFEEMWG